jgi:hypothetical protein
MDDSTVMLSAAKHLSAQRDRPFAALRACPERSEGGDSGGADFIIRRIFWKSIIEGRAKRGGVK